MNEKKYGNEIDEEHLNELHLSIIDFMESFRPLLDSSEQIHQDLIAKNLLEQSEAINMKLDAINEMHDIFSKVFIPNFFKIGLLEDKLNK